MGKIVFYIRALFHESIMTRIENIDARVAVDAFNKVCAIPAEEYRKGLHNIQLENLQAISPHIIVNHKDRGVRPYGHIQDKAKEELQKLDDADILIPLDDDDWLSPEIKNFKFIDGLSGWNGAILRPADWANLHYSPEHKLIAREDITTEEDKAVFNRGLLSNCQAFSGRLVKHLLASDDARFLLQLHTKCRSVTQTYGFKEYITNARLAVYVRHACNITLLARIFQNEELLKKEEVLKKEVLRHKDMYTQDLNLNEEYSWAVKYMHKLAELNKQL